MFFFSLTFLLLLLSRLIFASSVPPCASWFLSIPGANLCSENVPLSSSSILFVRYLFHLLIMQTAKVVTDSDATRGRHCLRYWLVGFLLSFFFLFKDTNVFPPTAEDIAMVSFWRRVRANRILPISNKRKITKQVFFVFCVFSFCVETRQSCW